MNENQNQPVRIEHRSAVPVIPNRKTTSLVLAVISGFLGLVGLIFPGLNLISNIVNDHFTFIQTVGVWFVFSLAPTVGLLLAVFGLKEKGYQHSSDRILLISMIILNMLSFAIPFVATIHHVYS